MASAVMKLKIRQGQTLGKTFAFDFSTEGAVVGGAVLSNPVVTVENVAGKPTIGTPEITEEDFYDCDGEVTAEGKGVIVRFTPSGLGSFSVACQVDATDSDGDVDTLELDGVLIVEASGGNF
jgi:hypothetical protein